MRISPWLGALRSVNGVQSQGDRSKGADRHLLHAIETAS
jgi:hypothetical protein